MLCLCLIIVVYFKFYNILIYHVIINILNQKVELIWLYLKYYWILIDLILNLYN